MSYNYETKRWADGFPYHRADDLNDFGDALRRLIASKLSIADFVQSGSITPELLAAKADVAQLNAAISALRAEVDGDLAAKADESSTLDALNAKLDTTAFQAQLNNLLLPNPASFLADLRVNGVSVGNRQTISGEYMRVGRVVTFSLGVQVTTLQGLTGDVTLTGLPFTSWSGRPQGLVLGEHGGIAGAPAALLLGSTIRLLRGPPNGGSPVLQASDVGENAYIGITGSYATLAA